MGGTGTHARPYQARRDVLTSSISVHASIVYNYRVPFHLLPTDLPLSLTNYRHPNEWGDINHITSIYRRHILTPLSSTLHSSLLHSINRYFKHIHPSIASILPRSAQTAFEPASKPPHHGRLTD
jgi:hypothetical protein